MNFTSKILGMLMLSAWLSVVILGLTSTLVYFDVLTLSRIAPDECTSVGLTCLDNAAINKTNNTVAFKLQNNLGFTVNLTNITALGDENTCGRTAGFYIGNAGINQSEQIFSNEIVNVRIICQAYITQGLFSTELKLNYLPEDWRMVRIRGKVE